MTIPERLLIRMSTRSLLTYDPWVLESTGKYKRLHPEAWEFLSSLSDCDATHAVTASSAGQVVGWFRFSVLEKGSLYAQGTWVQKQHRRRGIGKQLWLHALTRFRPHYVEVDTVSRGGAALVRSMRRQLTDFGWTHNGWTHNGI